jgi:dynein assembly factor 2, axonemal
MTVDSAPKTISGGATSLNETIDTLKLSSDEAEKFEKAFKDPKFLELFEQYAKDMQDPESRAETNAYLQQLERDGQIEQVYGKGTQLITPAPEFVVKGKEETSAKKVFLNICSCDKVRQQRLTIHVGTMHLSRQILECGE